MKKAALVGGAIIWLMAAAGGGVAAEPPAAAATGPGFTVARLVVCRGVEKREPLGVAEAFPADQKEVVAFLEASDVVGETPITFVWFAGGREVRQIPAKLGKGRRWRTWTMKNLHGARGEWKVEVRGADGTAVATAAFTVE